MPHERTGGPDKPTHRVWSFLCLLVFLSVCVPTYVFVYLSASLPVYLSIICLSPFASWACAINSDVMGIVGRHGPPCALGFVRCEHPEPTVQELWPGMSRGCRVRLAAAVCSGPSPSDLGSSPFGDSSLGRCRREHCSQRRVIVRLSRARRLAPSFVFLFCETSL